MDKSSGGSVTRTVTYYPVGGAMRINSTLYYVLKDHLGSASVVTDSTGAIVGEQRYYPYGETRFTSGTIYTDKLFTGQREMSGLGIYHYNARFYSPKLGRFLSADTIISSLATPQSLNRYMYVLGNPLRYTDPTGHIPCSDAYDFCGQMQFDGNVTVSIIRRALHRYNVKLKGNWDIRHASAVYFGVGIVGDKLAAERRNGETSASAFGAVFDDGVNFIWDTHCAGCRSVETNQRCGNDFTGDCAAGGGFTAGNTITFASMSGANVGSMERMTKNVVHELGHVYYKTIGTPLLGTDFSRDALRPNEFDGRLDWQQHPPSMNADGQETPGGGELFADTFLAWTYGAWNTDPSISVALAVNNAQNAMNDLVP